MGDAKALSFEPWQGQPAVAMICAHNPLAMNRQVGECQSFGLRLVYDPGQQVSDSATDLQAGVAAAEVLFVNEYERSVLCERIGLSPEQLAERLPVMITTLGKEGSVIEGLKANPAIKIGIAAPDQVVDPTGAGDAYRAGFLYGYLRQWDLRLCGQLGAVMASFIIEQHGTQRDVSPSEIKQRYHTTFNEELEL
jgi:adenosine kinase